MASPFCREAKKLRHQLHLSRQEGDALVLQADNLHRSMVSSKSSADSIFASQLLTPQQVAFVVVCRPVCCLLICSVCAGPWISDVARATLC